MMNDSLCRIIAGELQARAEQVEAAVRLLDEGNTVPFIARYRKEVTGGLDDTQLRNLETRLGYLRELEERRQAILKSIGEQGKLKLFFMYKSIPVQNLMFCTGIFLSVRLYMNVS